jgi:hypothetical protein
MPDLRVEEVPEEGLMLPACCDTEAWRFTDPTTREPMVRVLHDEDCADA